MRTMAKALGLALAGTGLAGCVGLGEILGWEETRKDLSLLTTRAEERFLPNPEKKDQFIVVEAFKLDLASDPPKVTMTLRNEAALDDYSADLEFGYEAAPGGIAEYLPDFVGAPLPNFDKGQKQTLTISAPAGHADKPAFARLKFLSGTDIPMTVARENAKESVRRGSLYLNGRVEVTATSMDLSGEKPFVKFTLMNVDEAAPAASVGNLDYRVELYDRAGKLVGKTGDSLDINFRRFYRWKTADQALGAFGTTVEILAEPPAGTGYAGVKPVLRVVKK